MTDRTPQRTPVQNRENKKRKRDIEENQREARKRARKEARTILRAVGDIQTGVGFSALYWPHSSSTTPVSLVEVLPALATLDIPALLPDSDLSIPEAHVCGDQRHYVTVESLTLLVAITENPLTRPRVCSIMLGCKFLAYVGHDHYDIEYRNHCFLLLAIAMRNLRNAGLRDIRVGVFNDLDIDHFPGQQHVISVAESARMLSIATRAAGLNVTGWEVKEVPRVEPAVTTDSDGFDSNDVDNYLFSCARARRDNVPISNAERSMAFHDLVSEFTRAKRNQAREPDVARAISLETLQQLGETSSLEYDSATATLGFTGVRLHRSDVYENEEDQIYGGDFDWFYNSVLRKTPLRGLRLNKCVAGHGDMWELLKHYQSTLKRLDISQCTIATRPSDIRDWCPTWGHTLDYIRIHFKLERLSLSGLAGNDHLGYVHAWKAGQGEWIGVDEVDDALITESEALADELDSV